MSCQKKISDEDWQMLVKIAGAHAEAEFAASPKAGAEATDPINALLGGIRTWQILHDNAVNKDNMPAASYCSDQKRLLQARLSKSTVCHGCFIKRPSCNARHWVDDTWHSFSNCGYCHLLDVDVKEGCYESTNEQQMFSVKQSLALRALRELEQVKQLSCKPGHGDREIGRDFKAAYKKAKLQAKNIVESLGRGRATRPSKKCRGENVNAERQHAAFIGQVIRTAHRLAVESDLTDLRAALIAGLPMLGVE